MAQWEPSERAVDYLRWSLPAQCWDGADFWDDTIVACWNAGEWNIRTEVDQCVHRDLDESESASVRATFNLDEQVRIALALPRRSSGERA